jgi:hypothetical protein
MTKTRAKYPIILIVEVTIIGFLTSLFSPSNTYTPTNNVGLDNAGYSDSISGIVHVFASSQNLVRCSDGKLAGSPGECPATDQCPPPQNNSVSNCTRGELLNGTSPESVEQNSTSNEINSTTGSESENTSIRCYENRSTPYTPRCDDSSSTS